MRVKKYPWYLSEKDIREMYELIRYEIGWVISRIKKCLNEETDDDIEELREKEASLKKRKQELTNILMKIAVGEYDQRTV